MQNNSEKIPECPKLLKIDFFSVNLLCNLKHRETRIIQVKSTAGQTLKHMIF